MDDIFVGRLMYSPVATIRPDTPIYEGAQTMVEQDIGSLIIVNERNRPEGILTTTDLVQLVANQEAIEGTVVEAYMNTINIATTANKPIEEAADTMMNHGIHHLPVVDDSRSVIGILTTTDLTAYLSTDWTPSPS